MVEIMSKYLEFHQSVSENQIEEKVVNILKAIDNNISSNYCSSY